MRFFRDCCVSAVLESSYTLCILRFSVRRFLALTKKPLFFEVPYRASRKTRFFRDSCVSAVLESSYTLCIPRFSVRRFLALTKKPLFFEMPYNIPLCIKLKRMLEKLNFDSGFRY